MLSKDTDYRYIIKKTQESHTDNSNIVWEDTMIRGITLLQCMTETQLNRESKNKKDRKNERYDIMMQCQDNIMINNMRILERKNK